MRPLAIGEIYDGAIRAIRANPRTMVGFSALVIALITLLGIVPQAFALATLLTSPLTDPAAGADDPQLDDVAQVISAGGLTLAVNLVQRVIATTIVSALLIVAVDGAVRGLAPSPAQLWSRSRSRMFAVLGLAAVVTLTLPLILAIAAAPGVAFLLVFPDNPAIAVALIVLGVLVGGLACVALYLGFWAVAAPALLLERLGVFASLRRSARLVRRNFWRVVGIGLLTALVTAVVGRIFTFPFGIIGALTSDYAADDDAGFVPVLVQLLISNVGTVLAGAVLYPFTAGVTALLYLDLRMRSEGLDVEVMRA